MKRTVAALAAGILLGSAGIGMARSQDSWIRNGVICTATGRGASRGVVCALSGRHGNLAIVNQRQIIVGTRKPGEVLYITSSR